MKYTLLIIVLVIVTYVCCEYLRVRKTVRLSQKIVERTARFENITTDTSVSLLVLGDSTAVGVGADSQKDTVPALLASNVGATYVENYAVSGAKIQDLESQLSNSKLSKYDYILVQIGGNNIVAREDGLAVGEVLRKLYRALPECKQVIHVCCGDVGATTILPLPVRGYYTKKTLAYHSIFEKIDMDSGVTYVNLYEPKNIDPFIKNPELYLAADGFHPSSLGYAYWFSKIKPNLR